MGGYQSQKNHVPDKIHIIEKGYSFHTIEEKAESPDHQTAITYYEDNLPSASNLSENILLFLDTNVLLRGYGISPERSALLYKFFLERKDQIVITKQIDQEFIRNRKKVIKLYENLPEAHLMNTSDPLAHLSFEFKTETEGTGPLENAKEVEDELSVLYANFAQIDNLSVSEISFLKKEFDFLSSLFSPKSSSRAVPEAPDTAFPGRGDILEKPKFPYGDYFICHEMLKHSCKRKQDVIFLTFDVAKGDWLKPSKEPYLHYINRTFALNDKMIFILDANKFFADLYSASFDALVPLPKQVDHYIIESELEKDLVAVFRQLEQRIRKLARQLNMDTADDVSAKDILDELNYHGRISDPAYYELMGVWSIRDGLAEGDMETIRRDFSEEELAEILHVVEDNLKEMNR